MTEPLIVCENLVKIYKVTEIEVVALQGLDLTVEPGELMGIVGASGSGKSSLLNVLGGLDRPSAGRVMVGGQDLLKMSDHELDRYRRTKVGFVWQQVARNLVPYLSAQANVELPMTVANLSHKQKRTRSRDLLEAVGLWDHRDHRLVQLSGGQQQRVAIAVAMANHPDLLLADEPTGELDSITAQQILELLQQMNERYGLTTIIVTHDPHIARAVNRVVTIRDGRISSETIRREDDVASALTAGITVAHAQHVFDEYLVVDEGGHLQLPHDLAERAGIGDRVTLELKEDGLLIKPVAGRSTVAAPLIDLPEDEPPAKRKTWWKRVRND
ncbi:MAG TPA: ABC transporter ATP-binding protein [Anaerolineae bacterium]|nr:ABC transporter ATP-binding protein [Anaerolineae bacterium]